MAPLTLLPATVGVAGYLATENLATDSIGQSSQLLDSDQFAVFCIVGALVVGLLAVIAVSGWRKS
jgi:hypothetical protein